MGSFQALLKLSLLLAFVIIPTVTADNSPSPPSPSKPTNLPWPLRPPPSSSSSPPAVVLSKSPPAANPPPTRGVSPPHPLTPAPFSSSSPPQATALGDFKCPKLLKKEMVARVLKRLKAPKTIKSILNKSAKFGICVAEKFCGCLALQFEPLIYGCFAVVGARCMKKVISNHVYGCTLSCAKSMMTTKRQVLGTLSCMVEFFSREI